MKTKNTTTLSLITIAILSLNGCGGDSAPTKSLEQSVSSITKLSEASKKHSNSDWEVLTTQITDLDKPKKFNRMLESSIKKNVALLTNVGINKEEAYAINSDMMYDNLVKLDIQRLDEEIMTECQENEICKEEAYASIEVDLNINKEEAYAMAEDFHKENNTTLVNDALVKEFTCDAGEVKTVQHYGLEDNFSTANGAETATPAPHIALVPSIANYPFPLTGYDEVSANRIFAETVKNLPSNVVKGNFYIGFKSNGTSLQGNDTMTLGNYPNDVKTISLNTLNWTTTSAGGTTIFSNSFNNIDVNNSTLLNMVQNNQQFDVVIQDDTSVDFITVATCSKPNPIKDVTTIVNKFECSEKETMLKILGGEIDNFAPTGDASNPIHPTPDLIAKRDLHTVYPGVNVTYDYTAYDHHFIDTLELNLSSNQTVTKAEFNIGYKVIGSSLSSNDAIYIGDYGTTTANGHLYDAIAPIIPQGWMVSDLTANYGYVAKVNLNNLLNNSTGATGTVFDTLVAQNKLDVYVQDDTGVDFTQLNLCIKDNCSEDAKEYKIDLSQLASWTTSATDVVENNPIPNVWDNSMNWIEFTTEESNGHRVLEIPFCACSNTIINLKRLKADNSATVKLDSNVIATQNASGQTSMLSGANGGVNASGNLTVPAGTNGGTNHMLKVEVTNQSAWFGVALEGTLNFKGNLGKCK